MSKDYLHGDTSGYGSHLTVLKFIFEQIDKPKLAIELGMGIFSTPFLIDHCDRLISIEQQDVEWYDKISKKYVDDVESTNKWLPNFAQHFNFAFNLAKNYDFAFVDGAAYFRAASVAEFMRIDVPVIVLHDSNLGWYGFGTLDQPAKDFGYFDYGFEWDHPNTRVFTTNKKLIDAIQNL